MPNERGRERLRSDPRLSACGLNCGLCPRYHTDGVSRCPGCGGDGFLSKRPACGIISCCGRQGSIEYCYLCAEYPCARHDGVECADSFITHRNMKTDFARAKQIGIEAYRAELDEKVAMLERLLERYNDGRRKSLFCTAVNLLSLEDVRAVMGRIEQECRSEDTKERAAQAARLLQEMADRRGIDLKLRKKK